MGPLFLWIVPALWLGILTSISPCPLATNIVAMSFIGRRVGSPLQVFFTGLLYTLGRTLTYVILGSLLTSSLLSAPYLSNLLQRYMNIILGPVLILVGMFLLELIKFSIPWFNISSKMQNRIEAWGLWGAIILGIVFALSFCPVSAALFFGSLIPLAIKAGSPILLPAVYGIGTALPVFGFAIIISLSAQTIGKVFDKTVQIERWSRLITGLIFIAIGMYFSVVYIFLGTS